MNEQPNPPAANEQQKRAGSSWTPERRAAQAERLRERNRNRASPSRPSSGSRKSSALPPTLPPSASPQNEGALLQTLERLLQEREATPTKAKTETKLLPDDFDEREKCLRLAKLPARIPVVAVDEICHGLGMRGLSAQEKEEGLDAFAALFWQWGLYQDGRVLVALWLFGVAAPRFVDWAEERRRKRAGLPPATAGKTNGSDAAALAAQVQAQAAELERLRAELAKANAS